MRIGKMNFAHTLVLFPFLGLCTESGLFAQVIDNTSSFRNIELDSYFRIHYENDFFTATDKYYTQGVNFEYVNPVFNKFFLNKFLYHPANLKLKYGITVEQDCYTPSTIRHEGVFYGDRPYGATMFANYFSVAVDSAKKQRVAAELTAGVLGPCAVCEQEQIAIHTGLHDALPLGWQYQIHTDAILNYKIAHERELLRFRNLISFSSYAEARAGTLSDKAGLGFSTMLGNCNVYSHQKIKIHFYAQAMVEVIGYDATMQGGLFDRGSPYLIPASGITRIVEQANAGAVIQIHKLYLEYFQTILSKEFTGGTYHRWGGIRIGW